MGAVTYRTYRAQEEPTLWGFIKTVLYLNLRFVLNPSSNNQPSGEFSNNISGRILMAYRGTLVSQSSCL